MGVLKYISQMMDGYVLLIFPAHSPAPYPHVIKLSNLMLGDVPTPDTSTGFCLVQGCMASIEHFEDCISLDCTVTDQMWGTDDLLD